jgi:hypothetical protein
MNNNKCKLLFADSSEQGQKERHFGCTNCHNIIKSEVSIEYHIPNSVYKFCPFCGYEVIPIETVNDL